MLDLNIGVMLIMAGIFFVTLIFLKMWLFEPLVKFMDEREEKLKEQMKMISQNSDDTKEIEEEIKEILQKAREEAKKIITEAKDKALQEAEKLKAVKINEIEKAKEKLKTELAKEKESLLSELLKEKDSVKSLIENKIRNAA